ncbi:phosphoribosylformylglycinamidine synthase [Candidatus Gottesmanbacteria bacterium RIFCSPHIGHO2_02_FULL_40_13]|uniref:Phosphoribosylformylglycinamidine synthase subunit PurL n=1 Tax=Candidatus Gottesmanbacteria bacterium RIFCSPHIGHO2_02_FULL_40_13 TaxID=1798384 RepID=A0A1F6AB57_9BACT|nr:MAG: phosphoribosylformylglycinamidine synthase [Candidatus Gottesmanbacteria bacterium RIFCSPHIGHO2_02_FULL_40_13]
MINRIEIRSKVFDARAVVRKRKLLNQGLDGKIKDIYIVDVYTLEKKLSSTQLNKIASMFSNPVTQEVAILDPKSIPKSRINKFSWAVEIGYLPGVTDNIAATAKEAIEDLLKIKFSQNEGVYTSQLTFIDGDLTRNNTKYIADSLYNPIIQRVSIKSYSEYMRDNGMDFVVPKVKISKNPQVDKINLDVSDEELKKIGKEGIKNTDGTRCGPLALSLPFMKAIQEHFKKLGRKPTDIELESIAQTWSEHCKHTIFADPLDRITEGLFKKYIKGATDYIRKKSAKGRSASGRDFCVSVFKDNSGAIIFDDDYLITHKVETHNSPSALDPYGGSITGIVGVNRDTIGFGLGAKPIANFYGFCFADPRIDIPLYKGANNTQKMLSSRRIMDGVIEGVNSGGNQSGIPTPSGFVYFDERYRGKPLVFAGTVGIIPKKIKGKLSYSKEARDGDYIVMIGGKVGKDGIHGATFSSEAMDSGSPSTAVQIGDPITQKKLSDAIVKEARNMDLYHSITDNGAGGLSCSVAEMAKESGGCIVDLDKVPLKYPGLEPWEIWVSESQERMTLAVPKQNWHKFENLMKRRGVEATVIGRFTNSKKCQVFFRGQKIIDLGMDFLHYGLPERRLTTSYTPPINDEPRFSEEKNLNRQFIEMISRLNIASYAFISEQYDHIVQSNLTLGPLQGRGRINADAVVLKPVLNSEKGIVLSYGLYPNYSDIDTYHMAAASIDTAIRNVVSVGADPDAIALLDNFCWCSSDDPERLGQLKRAAKACFDLATVFETPFISGKDSMFNDFKGYDRDGKPLKISIPPTLLISSIGVVGDVTQAVSLDVKFPGDLVYILGDTYDESGGSEYFSYISEKQGKNCIGNKVPNVNPQKNKKLYADFYQSIQKQLISSSISINHGGMGAALAKIAIAGCLGLDIRLDNLPGLVTRDDFALFSESQGRILVTISPKNKNIFEKLMKGNKIALIGNVIKEPEMIIHGLKGSVVINTSLKKIQDAYFSTFKGY